MDTEVENLSAVLHNKNDLRMGDVPIPEPSNGEVQLKILNCGVCGTDLHIYKEFGVGLIHLTSPGILGHEFSGMVTKLGDGVTHLKVGDRVAVEGGWACLTCIKCKTGRYNLCKTVQFKGVTLNGGLSTYTTHRADLCHKLTDAISDEEGAMVEPLAVVVHACQRAAVSIGETVLICGAGTIGLISIQVVKEMGASKVVVTDVLPERLEMAKQLGADYTINVKSKSPEEVGQTVENLLGDEVNVTIECSGTPAGVATGIYATTSGGNVTLIGIGDGKIEVPLGVAAFKEVDMRGVLAYCCGHFPTAVSLLNTKKVDLKPLITHRFKLEETLEAFKLADSGKAIKVMLRCAKD